MLTELAFQLRRYSDFSFHGNFSGEGNITICQRLITRENFFCLLKKSSNPALSNLLDFVLVFHLPATIRLLVNFTSSRERTFSITNKPNSSAPDSSTSIIKSHSQNKI